MVKDKKVLLAAAGQKPTIYRGLEIMSKGLKDWHRMLNGSVNQRVKISPPLTKREKNPMAVC
jgi:hypothetical protein